MPTLEIEGRKVQVDDSFLSLPPEQQQQTVNEIASQMKAAPGQSQEQQARPQGDPDRWSAANEAVEMFTLGGMEKAAAGTFGLIDSAIEAAQGKGFNLSDNYNRILERGRADRAAYNEQNPVRSAIGQGTGIALGVGKLPMVNPFKGGAALAKTGNIAATAGGYGGLSGALQDADSLGERAINIGLGTGLGAGIGVAAQPVARTIGRGISRVVHGKTTLAPTSEQLKTMAQDAYKRADDAGLVLNTKAYRNMVDDVVNHATTNTGFHPEHQTKAAAVLGSIQKHAETLRPSLGNIEIQRRVLRSVKDAGGEDGRIAGLAINRLDEIMENIDPSHVVAGRAKDATSALKEARSLWSRTRKSEDLDWMNERVLNRASQFSGSGHENAMRTEFRQLAQNRKKMRSYSKDEQEAIKRAVRGGPGENAMRMIGKYAPTSPVSMLSGALLGQAAGGPMGAGAGAAASMLIPVAGALGRWGATRATAKNIDTVGDLVRRGGKIQPKPAQVGTEKLINRLVLPRAGDVAFDVLPEWLRPR